MHLTSLLVVGAVLFPLSLSFSIDDFSSTFIITVEYKDLPYEDRQEYINTTIDSFNECIDSVTTNETLFDYFDEFNDYLYELNDSNYYQTDIPIFNGYNLSAIGARPRSRLLLGNEIVCFCMFFTTTIGRTL